MKQKIQIGIIDDESDGRDYISLLLANEFPETEIILEASNIEDAYIKLLKNLPEIIFLDIELKDGSAFELLSKFKEISSQIIFVTAYEHYAVQAIKNGAVDYLLKPIKKIDFVVATNKTIERIKKSRIPNNALLIEGKINLPTLQGFRRVNIADIIRCEADANYTLFYLIDKTKIMVSKNLKEFESQLTLHNFFRIHNKHLINITHLKEYVKGKGGQVVMTDNATLDVSVRKKIEFLQAIQHKE